LRRATPAWPCWAWWKPAAGWQGRYEQAELVTRFFKGLDAQSPAAQRLKTAIAGPAPDLSAGYQYLQLERMAFYVNKDAYRAAIRAAVASFA
jgi:hypothetical protein